MPFITNLNEGIMSITNYFVSLEKTNQEEAMLESCRKCVLERSLVHYPADAPQVQVEEYRKAVHDIVRDFPDEDSAPELAWHIKQIRKKVFHLSPADFTGIKNHYNLLLMSLEEKLEASIRESGDPLFCAMQYAMTGNYIDYASLENVEEAKLQDLLNKAGSIQLDQEAYRHFRESVRQGGKVVYITDNCGEIVLDKLLIREMLRMNPDLSVTVLVRGSSEGNDATMEDAVQVGLPSVCHVMGNGAPLDATVLRYLSEEARNLLFEADFIMAKGQANYESLHGCGLHIFYLFMCKCSFFTTRFQVPQYSGILTEEVSHEKSSSYN